MNATRCLGGSSACYFHLIQSVPKMTFGWSSEMSSKTIRISTSGGIQTMSHWELGCSFTTSGLPPQSEWSKHCLSHTDLFHFKLYVVLKSDWRPDRNSKVG